MKRKPNLQIQVSRRFKKAYGKAIFSLQGLTEGTVHDFVNRQRSSPKTVLHHYDRLAHLSVPVIEIDLTGGHRLLAHYSEERLLLLDMGAHEVVSRYDINKLVNDLLNNEPAPRQFWPENGSKFFVRYPDKTTPFKYANEITPEWLYFLEEQQQSVFDEIADAILTEQHPLHFLMGGPGTGKTCILLNMLKFFADLDYVVGIIISDELVSYVEETTRSNISQYCVNAFTYPSLDLLLVDDPHDITSILRSTQWNEVKTVVVAFDPLQLPDDLPDGELDELGSAFDARHHILSICYRQKENVGKTTKQVVDNVAASTPFLRQDKITSFRQARQTLTQLSNDLIFVNPHGYTQYYPASTVNDVIVEVRRILKYEWLMWKHWPGLLILLDGCDLSEAAYNALSPLMQMNYVKILTFDRIEEVKGLEFQHVFVFINKALFEEIQNGFKGSGQKTYHRRRLLRIPFSRAKDSLVTFAIENNE